MPNAQIPYVGFWQNLTAQGDLRDFLKAQGLTDPEPMHHFSN